MRSMKNDVTVPMTLGLIFQIGMILPVAHSEEPIKEKVGCRNSNSLLKKIDFATTKGYEKALLRYEMLYHCLVKMKNATEEEKRESYAVSVMHKIESIANPFDENGKNPPEFVKRLLKQAEKDKKAHTDLLKKHLYIALGLSGGSPPDQVLTSFLKDEQTPGPILKVVLKAIENSRENSIRTLPYLLKLLNHPYSKRDQRRGPKLITTVNYPVRKQACTCLKKLNIDCEEKKELVEEGKLQLTKKDKWPYEMYEMHYKPSQKSLENQIRQWVLSENPETWKAALEAVHKMDRPDVQKLMEDLKENGKLSDKKISYLKNLRNTEEK